MRLSKNIESKPLLHAKGWLFLALGLLGATGLLLEAPSLRTAVLLGITLWAFCRFYYFLFHVLEHYAGRQRPYAGLLDALKYIIRGKNSPRTPEKVSPNR